MELMTYLATQETNTVFTSSGEGGIYNYHICCLVYCYLFQTLYINITNGNAYHFFYRDSLMSPSFVKSSNQTIQ